MDAPLQLLRRDNSAAPTQPRSAWPVAEPEELRELEAVYGEHADEVLRWAVRLGVARGEAQDVVQDVFLIVQRKLPTLRRGQNLRSWLFGITRRVVQRERRRGRREHPFLESEADDQRALAAGPDQQLEVRQNLDRVYAVLGSMRESERTAILLFEIERLTGQELAELMGLTVAQVWGILHRARKTFERKLRELEAREAEESRAR